MAKRKIGGCDNCQQDINYISSINHWPGLGASTEEGAWCFGCFKNISHCQVCKKSVAQVEYNKHKPDLRLRWTVKPADGFTQHQKFICSQNCLDKHLSEKKRKRQERLSQGWKECEGCVKKYAGIIKKYNLKINIKLVPPGEKLCGNYNYVGKGGCKEWEEVGKPAQQRAQVKAQNYWNSLSREQRLQEIERLDGVFTAKWWGKNYTAEEIAAWEKVPPDMEEEFCRHEMGESWEEIKRKNNSRTTNTQSQVLSSSETTNDQIKKKEVELQKLKENKGENSEEFRKLEQEIKELLENQKNIPANESSTKNKSNMITYSIIGFSLVTLIGIVILLAKTKQKNPKIN